jgi:DNA-binding XRE family transcriptional regulator
MAVNYSLAEVVSFHRNQAALSRNDLAVLAGVGKTAIYDIEHGKQTLRWSTIIAILTVLNIDIEFNSPLMETYEKSKNQNP